ncbi:hypothetical protein Q0F99_06720 [Rathayibacter oskolensis]|uniref:hypothetical protein n=1 Tax=Rathayibacter oskolensis TaxID=1891671 RepID=UPI00265D8988|nr:hypothetical protein [Rathayibacter oskolensis]WKK72621.1 hypothetical protein Q0F99_06720 [Rathayibacter oskolensis]
MRNNWAHGEVFDRARTNRAIETAQTLLQEVAMDDLAEELGEMRRAVLAEADGDSLAAPASALPTPTSRQSTPEEPALVLPAAPGAAAADLLPIESIENEEHLEDPGSPAADTSEPPLRRPRGTARYSEPDSAEEAAPATDEEVAAPAVTIEIDAHDELSYAMANARIQPVKRILVRNSGEELRGASLDLEVVDANGSLGGPRTIRLDLAAGQDKPLENVSLTLDPGRMLAVEQRRPGSIRAMLRTADGDKIAEASVDVLVLAASEWRLVPIQLGLELLPSFVQPNAAIVETVLREAADLLEAATGTSGLNGYQSQDPARVDSIVEAIWDAIRARASPTPSHLPAGAR